MSIKQKIFIALGAVLLLIFVLLNTMPSSAPYSIIGTVVSKGASQGYGEGGDKLRVKTDAGEAVSVYVHGQRGIRIGDRLELSAYNRYLLRPKIQFIKIIR